ncbi:kinase-like domain-containing protein [Rhizophagus irregularis DAOM 181602=DAOM 197198]|nr:kinase-like domain-containing protein [Rhizophagus irregularis DAOM 181602=DAOM 197198]
MSFTDKINYFGKLCESCGKTKINIRDRFSKWCKLCQINQIISLRNNLINWTSGNEEIDSFIRQKQSNEFLNEANEYFYGDNKIYERKNNIYLNFIFSFNKTNDMILKCKLYLDQKL